MFEKILVPEIWPNMLQANQIGGFLMLLQIHSLKLKVDWKIL